ncbi:MAG: hypothetical protein KA063_03000 [Firmicutes bacterium]|nr:hypothetical protein [Bacillota bacterium]
MTNRRQPWTIGWLVALVVVSALTSTWIAARRHRVEEMARRVELCMDWREGALYSQRIGLAEDDYLAQLRDAGITSIALDEDTLGSLQASGDLVMLRTSELAAVSSVAPGLLPAAVGTHAASGGRTVVVPLNQDTAAFLADRLPIRLQGGPSLVTMLSGQTTAFIIGLPLEEARNINLGPRPSVVARIAAAGLRATLRFTNYPGVSEKWIDSIVRPTDPAKEVDLAIFAGTEVLGYPALTAVTARALGRARMIYGSIEFQAQAGENQIMRAADYSIVRVHSITRGEVDRGLSIQTMADRYVRAARERNIRVMYMRPIMKPIDARSLPELNDSFVRAVASGLQDAGFTLGAAVPLGQADPGLAPTLVVVVGIAAGCVMLLDAIWSLTFPISAGLVAVAAAGFAALSAFGRADLAKQAAALAAAIAYPSLSAFVLLSPFPGSGPNGSADAAERPFGWARVVIVKFIAASALTLAGGLMLAGCLTSLAFMTKARQFLGVKLMHVAPMLFLLMAYWKHVYRRGNEAVTASARRVLSSPILVWHAVVIGALAAGGLIYIARTGNTSVLPLGVPAWEQAMRSALERLLPVRPRTKEFLLGHPAFILAAALCWAGDRAALLPLAALALIGQISLANTFAHLHTPIAVTLARVLVGAGLGLAIGLAVAGVLFAARRGLRRSVGKIAGREG